MGKKSKEIRVVLDTNVLVSALILTGKLNNLVDLWREGRIIPLLSRDTFDEFRRVLEYPKFVLSKKEIKTIIEEEILPFFEVFDITHEVTGICRDPDDDKFLACAVSASADFIVSGDKDLLVMKTYLSVKIISPSQFFKLVD
jgi:putative PIN family toxin of toxin-antitoxin system